MSLEFLFPQVNIYYAMSHAPFPGHTIRIKKIITSLVLVPHGTAIMDDTLSVLYVSL